MKRYTVGEAARRLRRDPKLVYRWLALGRLRGEKYGYSWLVTEREIERFMRAEPRRLPRRGKGR